MRQVVDFKNDESISNFIMKFRNQSFDQTSNYKEILRKAAMLGFISISNILKGYENVK
jgi:hypothetical protein